jgi:hypothetical protein
MKTGDLFLYYKQVVVLIKDYKYAKDFKIIMFVATGITKPVHVVYLSKVT